MGLFIPCPMSAECKYPLVCRHDCLEMLPDDIKDERIEEWKMQHSEFENNERYLIVWVDHVPGGGIPLSQRKQHREVVRYIGQSLDTQLWFRSTSGTVRFRPEQVIEAYKTTLEMGKYS